MNNSLPRTEEQLVYIRELADRAQNILIEVTVLQTLSKALIAHAHVTKQDNRKERETLIARIENAQRNLQRISEELKFARRILNRMV